MTLFDAFNKPDWQNQDPEVRISAIEAMSDKAVLLSLVRDDPDAEVRSKALEKISDTEILEALLPELRDNLLDQARSQLLAVLLPEPGRLESIEDDASLLKIAELADDGELIAATMKQLNSTEVRMDTAANHPLARIRIAAAGEIESLEAIRELMSRVRHRDKSVYRLCKERLDRIHEQERVASERQAKLAQLTGDALQLSTAVDSPEYKARFQVLQYHWEELKPFADPAQTETIEQYLDACARRVAATDQATLLDEERQQRKADATQSFQLIIDELSGLEASASGLEDTASLQQFVRQLDAREDRWIAALRDARPSPDQTRDCKKLLADWRALAQVFGRLAELEPTLARLQEEFEGLEKTDFMAHHRLHTKTARLLSRLSFPEAHKAAEPASLQQLHTLQARLEERLETLKKQQNNKLQQLDTAFSGLRKELDDSHFNNADRYHNKIKSLLRHLGPEHQDRFHAELRPLSARLQEIHDWQGFAIEPKKLELCERMAGLVGSDESPDTLAAKIKALQAEWKSLGHLSPKRDQALWKKFHAAAEQAYQPCKEAFSRQAELRKENFRQRMQLVEQLVDYDRRMNWPGSDDFDRAKPEPDWRLVQKTLDTARAAFNRLQPVSGRHERKSRVALKEACDNIYSHIRDEYDRNIGLKQKLAEEAGTLLEIEDLRTAISRAKAIQQEWKRIGITPRQADRKLWKEMRSACDALFGKLDEQRQTVIAAKNEQAKKARARAHKERQRWPRLLDMMKACALKNDDPQAALELWEAEGGIPAGIDKPALREWWEHGPGTGSTDEDLRTACIAMEILCDIDSPAEDKEARMAYQMNRLLEGLGGSHGDPEAQRLQQINDFIRLRPTARWFERFCCGGAIIPRQKPGRA